MTVEKQRDMFTPVFTACIFFIVGLIQSAAKSAEIFMETSLGSRLVIIHHYFYLGKSGVQMKAVLLLLSLLSELGDSFLGHGRLNVCIKSGNTILMSSVMIKMRVLLS